MTRRFASGDATGSKHGGHRWPDPYTCSRGPGGRYQPPADYHALKRRYAQQQQQKKAASPQGSPNTAGAWRSPGTIAREQSSFSPAKPSSPPSGAGGARPESHGGGSPVGGAKPSSPGGSDGRRAPSPSSLARAREGGGGGAVGSGSGILRVKPTAVRGTLARSSLLSLGSTSGHGMGGALPAAGDELRAVHAGPVDVTPTMIATGAKMMRRGKEERGLLSEPSFGSKAGRSMGASRRLLSEPNRHESTVGLPGLGPGSYTLPSAFDAAAAAPFDGRGSPAFTNSGRTKDLTTDAKHFLTLPLGGGHRVVGPGYYGSPDVKHGIARRVNSAARGAQRKPARVVSPVVMAGSPFDHQLRDEGGLSPTQTRRRHRRHPRPWTADEAHSLAEARRAATAGSASADRCFRSPVTTADVAAGLSGGNSVTMPWADLFASPADVAAAAAARAGSPQEQQARRRREHRERERERRGGGSGGPTEKTRYLRDPTRASVMCSSNAGNRRGTFFGLYSQQEASQWRENSLRLSRNSQVAVRLLDPRSFQHLQRSYTAGAMGPYVLRGMSQSLQRMGDHTWAPGGAKKKKLPGGLGGHGGGHGGGGGRRVGGFVARPTAVRPRRGGNPAAERSRAIREVAALP